MVAGSQRSEAQILIYNMNSPVARRRASGNRLTHSLENRATANDALLHDWKSNLLRIWIPLIAGAARLIGLFGGIEIQSCRDSVPTAAVTPTQTAVPNVPSPAPQQNGAAVEIPNRRSRSHAKAYAGARHEQ